MTTVRKAINARHVAAEVIQRWMASGDFPDRLLVQVRKDRAFVMEVVYGVVKRKRALEWVLKHCTRHLPELPLRAHAMVGLYQLLFMDSVEAYAAVNETVLAAKAEFGPSQAGFVNAILRRVSREKAALLEALGNEAPGTRFSHPELLIQRWTALFGAAAANALCEWNNQPAPVILRCRADRVTMDDFLDRLRAAGIRAEPHAFNPARYCTLPRGVPLEEVPGYEDGWFVVQDPSTSLAVDLLDPVPHERILDACAAPGGKTVDMAERMGGGETLVAMDIHEDRLRVLRENLARLSFEGVRVVCGDMAACRPGGPGLPELEGEWFDGILLDVPCTNTGVLRRRPDARWRFTLERMNRIRETQRGILDGAAAKLRVGGRLVYSTCSLEPEEDEQMVAGWLQTQPGFELVAGRKLVPPGTGVDGAYAALLRRTV